MPCKVLQASLINGVAVPTFALAGAVHWPIGLLMAAGGIVGGYGGAAIARRVNPVAVRLPAHDLANNLTCKVDNAQYPTRSYLGEAGWSDGAYAQLVSYSRRMDEGSTICAMAAWLGRTIRVEQERGAVEMPFMSIRAPNAVQYRGVCLSA